jgi:hypothetical protein
VSNAAIDIDLVYMYPYGSTDLTGYTVESNKNICVFVSIACGMAAAPSAACDYNWEQIHPTHTAGHHYLVWNMSPTLPD